MTTTQTNPIKDCPWGPWAGCFLAVVFALMFVCLLFDRDATKLMNVLSWLLLAGAAIMDRQGRHKGHIIPVAVAMAIVVGASAAAAWFYGDFPAAVYAFVKYQVAIVWLAVIWLAAPVFLHPVWKDRRAPGDCQNASRWATALATILLLFAFQATLSAAGSLFPKDSMELLGSEVLPYAGMFIIIKRCAWCMQDNWWRMGARTVWLLVVISAVAMAGVALVALLSPTAAHSLLDAGFFRIDSDAPGTRRLQFLFQHHNRAGFYAATAIFLCLAGAWGSRGMRIIGIVGAACAAVALPFTLTRGAMIAAAAAMVIFVLVAIIRNRKIRWPLAIAVIVILPVLWIGLPDRYQKHIAKIANPENYHEGTGGSIGARLVMWETAADMIKKRPGLGFGYGFENFESAARVDNPGQPQYFEGASHAHNHWLETAAETGIPGFVLLFLLTLLRIAGLAIAYWLAMRSQYKFAWLLLLWLCLELMIQFYGMTNYTLRRNLGFLTYWIWAGSVALVILSVRQRAKQVPC